MALYDDDEPPQKKTKEESGSANITMKFLQQQLAQKKAQSLHARPAASMSIPSVFNLSGQGPPKGGINMKVVPKPALNPVKASAINDAAPLKFLPSAALDDKVLLFNEIVVENEYQPQVPNDYYEERKRLDLLIAREKAARDIAERLAREHKEEEQKRTKGAAIAPPMMLQEEPKEEPPPKSVDAQGFKVPTLPPTFTPSFGGQSKGLGVAASIMSKMGYKQGAGLGKSEQGMSTALTVERKGARAGQIMNEAQTAARNAQQSAPLGVGSASMASAMKHSSRVVLLRNMTTKAEVDDELSTEITEEMGKYGNVTGCKVHVMPEGVSEEDEVRIFVEFANVPQAIKAFIVLNNRFFAGRTILASFYSHDDYKDNVFEKALNL